MKMMIEGSAVMRIATMMNLVLASVSCLEQIGCDDTCNESGTKYSDVTFLICNPDGTKSSVVSEETDFRDACLMIYLDGDLYYSCTMSPPSVTLELECGKSFAAYVLANADIDPPLHEDDVRRLEFSVDDMSDLEGNIPMAWAGIVDVDGDDVVEVLLERLAAKIEFSIDSSIEDRMEVVSARLCQCMRKMRPFENDSKAGADEDVIDGDWASAADIALLNQGEPISFYTLENCQGILLADNTDPWAKIPDNLRSTGMDGLCTYLETVCRFTDGVAYGDWQGSVLYRFYLGEDAVSDFSIKRNTVQDICLVMTEDGLESQNWKVDASGASRMTGEVDVTVSFNDSRQLVATASEVIEVPIRVYGSLSSHIRTLKGTDAFFAIGTKCSYYKRTDPFDSGYHTVRLSGEPVVIDESVVRDVLEYIRSIEYWSNWDGGKQREILKPTGMELSIDFEPDEYVTMNVTFPDYLVYGYTNIKDSFGMQPPSTFNNHNCRDCPEGAKFKAGDVTMKFTVSSNVR